MLAIGVLKETEELAEHNTSATTNTSGTFYPQRAGFDTNEVNTLHQFYEGGIKPEKQKKKNKRVSARLLLWKMQKYGKGALIFFGHIGGFLLLWTIGKRRLLGF